MRKKEKQISEFVPNALSAGKVECPPEESIDKKNRARSYVKERLGVKRIALGFHPDESSISHEKDFRHRPPRTLGAAQGKKKRNVKGRSYREKTGGSLRQKDSGMLHASRSSPHSGLVRLKQGRGKRHQQVKACQRPDSDLSRGGRRISSSTSERRTNSQRNTRPHGGNRGGGIRERGSRGQRDVEVSG